MFRDSYVLCIYVMNILCTFRDVVQKTCLRQWTIGKSGERGSGISVLPAWHDDDDVRFPYPYHGYVIDLTRSRVSYMVFLAIWTSNFFKQASSMRSRSFSSYVAHVNHPLQASLWCPYFWHLRHLRGYIFQPSQDTSHSSLPWEYGANYMSGCKMLIWICSLPFLMEILLMFITSCFSSTAVISSVIAKANSPLLINHLDIFNLSSTYALLLVV